MSILLVLLIILGCTAYLYFKGTFVKSFAMAITAVCSCIAAFGYFEVLANVLISRNSLVSWAQSVCFISLFVLVFAILQVAVFQLLRQPIDLGLWPERIGRVVCGIFSGLIISGILLTGLAMAPLSNKTPYQRFDENSPDAERPSGALLSADGFVTRWFNLVSGGSFSGEKSFATLHADFLNQVFLNRHGFTRGISTLTGSNAIEAPKQKGIWPAPEELKGPDGQPISPKSGHNLMAVRIGMTTDAIKRGDTFTLSQLRLVCKPRKEAKKPFRGKGKGIYPAGYFRMPNQLQTKKLADQIKIESASFDGRVKWIDFAFYVPDGFIPVLAQFKQNGIAQLSPPVKAENAPAIEPFFQLSEVTEDAAEIKPAASSGIYGLELATGYKFLAGLTVKIDDPNQWQTAQTDNSIIPAQFEDEKIDYVRAELKIEKPAEELQEQTKEEKPETTRDSSRRQRERRPDERRRFRPPRRDRQQPGRSDRRAEEESRGIPGMLEPADGYKLLSLKCNNPATGAVISSEQLPVLVELFGLTHRPVGVIAVGNVDEEYICEFDYCSRFAEDDPNGLGLVITEDDTVARPFPDTIWLTEKAREISEFYVLYMVKSGRNAFITSVKPADSQTAAGFEKFAVFSIK